MATSEAAFPPVRPGSVHTDADAADGMAEYRGTAGPALRVDGPAAGGEIVRRGPGDDEKPPRLTISGWCVE